MKFNPKDALYETGKGRKLALRGAIVNPKSKIELPNAQCPMPNAQCPMPIT
ncbi:MAG: hypothetical protein V7L04_19305 [Nostoc sp.]|uniref:hypothetical protein n=1 Tax=Nostoc sp. TaxID=1180 RepID=UPI002FFC70C0